MWQIHNTLFTFSGCRGHSAKNYQLCTNSTRMMTAMVTGNLSRRIYCWFNIFVGPSIGTRVFVWSVYLRNFSLGFYFFEAYRNMAVMLWSTPEISVQDHFNQVVSVLKTNSEVVCLKKEIQPSTPTNQSVSKLNLFQINQICYTIAHCLWLFMVYNFYILWHIWRTGQILFFCNYDINHKSQTGLCVAA